MSVERELLRKLFESGMLDRLSAIEVGQLLAQPEQAEIAPSSTKLQDMIKDYLLMGGLFNPELVNHDTVRDLILDARAELDLKRDEEIILAYRGLVKRAIGRFAKTKLAHGIGGGEE